MNWLRSGRVGIGTEARSLDEPSSRQLTPFELDVATKQDWAPDGEHIVFSSQLIENGTFVSANIATIRPDGTDLQYLTHNDSTDFRSFVGSYSPDGHWISYRFFDHGMFGLFKMLPDGTHVKAILELSSVSPRFIDWGPRPKHAKVGNGN